MEAAFNAVRSQRFRGISGDLLREVSVLLISLLAVRQWVSSEYTVGLRFLAL